MNVNYLIYERFGNLLSEEILKKLTGEHESFKRFSERKKPSNSIFIGNLSGLSSDANKNEELLNSKSSVTNSLTIRFLLNEFNSNITVKTNLFTYIRVYPSYNEEIEFIKKEYSEKDIDEKDYYSLAHIWKRIKINLEPTILNNKSSLKNLDFNKYIENLNECEELFYNDFKISKKALKSETDYNNFIKKSIKKNSSYLNWKCKLKIDSENYIQKKEKYNLVSISLINESIIPKEFNSTTVEKNFETSFFNPKLDIDLGKNEICKFKYDYSYEENLKNYESYFRCLNCHANFENNHIITKGYASFNQKKISPRSNLTNVNITFERLSKDIGELYKISELMDKHFISCKKNLFNDENSLSDFEYMKERFKEGINTLSTDINALRAFNLMNKTFELNNKEKSYHSWRLFQIVFIVSLINDVINKNKNRDKCELLHVMTGGGKSEAYFGIVIFSAFYDRIIGKEFGVTAFTKFPLRMLSIQQLQRIANLFIWAEQIRIKENLGGEQFSIAYFVGSQDDEFPSHNRKIIEDINKSKKDNIDIPGRIIEKCPLCGSKVVLNVDNNQKLVLHKCTGCGKKFRLLFSDDEIYRVLPTFIVSTVDKLAGISTNRRIKNLFGGKLDTCKSGHGFIPRNDRCDFEKGYRDICKDNGVHVKNNFNTGPTLMIQDEMHLIREGFGTIDSHFESLTENLEKEMTGETFKRIAMTATVTGAKKQVKQLYDKDVCIFPPKVKDENNENFFFIEERNSDGSNRIQRKIIGLKPNSHKNLLIIFILRYISQFIKNIEDDLIKFSETYDFNENDLKEIIISYKKILTYHKKKADTQVVNYFAKSFINNREDTYDIEARPLTGENNLDYIKETINLVNNYYNNENKADKLLTVDATSIVSHGVDIDKWNIMIFNGMPNNTSEYIQALSRAGRKKYGIIFLTFINTRTRDLSFYQHFNDYHDILEHKVEDVALSRWAKLGFKQTFTSVFSASILNFLSNKLEMPIYNKETVVEVFNDPKNEKLVIDFIKKAYISDSKMLGSEYFNKNIEIEFNKRLKYLRSYGGTESNFFPNALKDNKDKYFKTQFGMRGIQDEIVLSPFSNEYNFRKNWRI